ncbi:DUF4129 domain-containing protein [Haloarcula marina]|uniref:DUF4129 domain-containing protein n=1 Tax=Haloarcula marina TaxID=2961574 RepID=UPI0020B705AD|nr:DUF4129 domain-containing protein [Halomicroarcula marina]
MNVERVVSVAVACLVVVAVGLSASTLDESMSTDPGDAIDPEYDALPIGEEQAGDVEAAAKGLHEQYENQRDGSVRRPERAESGPTSQSQQSQQSSQSSQSSDGQSGADSSETQGQTERPTDPGPDWWAILTGLALVAAVLGLTYRYRRRIVALLGTVVGAERRSGEVSEMVPNPTNGVQRAWVELLRRAGITDPRTRTPRDCARRAVETGFDADAVDRLRHTFEEVQYGQTQPTPEQERRASETLDGLEERE